MDLQGALHTRIRSVPDYPKPGILFKDITPLLQDPPLLSRCVGALIEALPVGAFDIIGGIEARGFIFGSLVAHTAGKPFFPFRKVGKLPYRAIREAYALEYGQAEIEIHVDAIAPGQRVLIVDDLLATGGTAAAAVRLVRRAGGEVAGVAFVVELTFLPGRRVLREAGVQDERIVSLVGFGDGE
jgi:adenine phosphoribosyltransferase